MSDDNHMVLAGNSESLKAFLKAHPEWRENAHSMHIGRGQWLFSLERSPESALPETKSEP